VPQRVLCFEVKRHGRHRGNATAGPLRASLPVREFVGQVVFGDDCARHQHCQFSPRPPHPSHGLPDLNGAFFDQLRLPRGRVVLRVIQHDQIRAGGRAVGSVIEPAADAAAVDTGAGNHSLRARCTSDAGENEVGAGANADQLPTVGGGHFERSGQRPHGIADLRVQVVKRLGRFQSPLDAFALTRRHVDVRRDDHSVSHAASETAPQCSTDGDLRLSESPLAGKRFVPVDRNSPLNGRDEFEVSGGKFEVEDIGETGLEERGQRSVTLSPFCGIDHGRNLADFAKCRPVLCHLLPVCQPGLRPDPLPLLRLQLVDQLQQG